LRSLTNVRRYDPTIEDSYSVTRTIDGTTYSLRLTDTAGQEEYRGLWSQANLKCDAFLLVYDITQSSSLEALDFFTQMIDIEREDRMEQNQILPVCIVAGNKCDLQNMRQITARDGLDWSRQHNFGFMETSAREMVNIEETFARKLFQPLWIYGGIVLTYAQLLSAASSKRERMQQLVYRKRTLSRPRGAALQTPVTGLSMKPGLQLPTLSKRNFLHHPKRVGTHRLNAGKLRFLILRISISAGWDLF
jgi:small GTP-binding protein